MSGEQYPDVIYLRIWYARLYYAMRIPTMLLLLKRILKDRGLKYGHRGNKTIAIAKTLKKSERFFFLLFIYQQISENIEVSTLC